MKKVLLMLFVSLFILNLGIQSVFAYDWEEVYRHKDNSVVIHADLDSVVVEGKFIAVDVRITLAENRPGYAKYALARYVAEEGTMLFIRGEEKEYDINNKLIKVHPQAEPKYPKKGTIMYDLIYYMVN